MDTGGVHGSRRQASQAVWSRQGSSRLWLEAEGGASCCLRVQLLRMALPFCRPTSPPREGLAWMVAPLKGPQIYPFCVSVSLTLSSCWWNPTRDPHFFLRKVPMWSRDTTLCHSRFPVFLLRLYSYILPCFHRQWKTRAASFLQVGDL